MKSILPLVVGVLLYVHASSQCNAININTIVLTPQGSSGANCFYKINLNTTLTNGNASLKPYYRCGATGTEFALDTCFVWPVPSTLNFSSNVFSCPCTQNVFVTIRGTSSSNCNGSECVEFTLTNLDLKVSNFNVYRSGTSQVCMDWIMQETTPGGLFFVESSANGEVFRSSKPLTRNDLLVQNNVTKHCMTPADNEIYFRLKMVDLNGKSTYSPIRSVKERAGVFGIYYNSNSHQIIVSGAPEDIQSKTLDIYNSNGQKMKQVILRNNTVDVQDLALGVYYVRINTGKNAYVKNLLLQ